MRKILNFLFSKRFVYNVIAIIIVWAVVVFGTLSYLKSHTNYGEKLEVPSLYKIHTDDLPDLMKSKQLAYEVVDSVYIDGWPKGTVCWQYPRPTDSTSEYVKTGRIIQVSIVPYKPKMVKVPNVIDKSKRMAESQLESIGLRTKISYKASNEGAGYVMNQLVNNKPIRSGMSVVKGTVVQLVVAKGNGGAATALPNLVGMTINEARSRLLNLTLSLHPECPNCVNENEIGSAIIKSQSPRGGEGILIAAGSTVTVWAEK